MLGFLTQREKKYTFPTAFKVQVGEANNFKFGKLPPAFRLGPLFCRLILIKICSFELNLLSYYLLVKEWSSIIFSLRIFWASIYLF